MQLGEMIYDFVFNGAQGLQNLEAAEQAVDGLEQCLIGADRAVAALEEAVARHIQPIVEDALRAGDAFEDGLAEGMEEAAVAAVKLAREMGRTDDRMEGTGQSARGLERDIDRVDDELGQATRAAGVFSASLAGIRSVGAGVGRVMGSLQAQIAGVVTAYGVLNANQRVAETRALSDALGVTTDTLTGLGAIAGQVGLSFDSIGGFIGEANGKITEFLTLGERSPISDALKALRLDAEALQGLNPEDAFLRIAEAVKGLPDRAQAVSAADAIFGGNAAEFFGLLRQYDGSVSDVIEKQNELNFVTDEFGAIARRNAQSVGQARRAVTSIFDAFSVLLVRALRPSVEAITAWIAANRELIRSRIAEYAETTARAFEAVARATSVVVQVVDRAIDGFNRLGAFKNVLIAIAAALAIAFAPFAAAMVALILILEDFAVFMEGGDSLIGRFVGVIQTAFGPIVDEIEKRWRSLLAFFGTTPEELGVAVDRVLARVNLISVRWGELTSDIQGAWDGVRKSVSDGVDEIIGFFENLSQSAERIGEDIAAFFNAPIERVSGLIESIGGLLGILPSGGVPGSTAASEVQDLISLIRLSAAPDDGRAASIVSQDSRVSNNSTINQRGGDIVANINVYESAGSRETGRHVRREIERISSDSSIYGAGAR